MTRFARAKGSKASNERREEEPTPWHIMRQQLAEQLNSGHVRKDENLSNGLKNIYKNEPVSNGEVWSEFGEIKSNCKKSSCVKKEKKKSKHHTVKVSNDSINELKLNFTEDTDDYQNKKRKPKVIPKGATNEIQYSGKLDNSNITCDSSFNDTNKTSKSDKPTNFIPKSVNKVSDVRSSGNYIVSDKANSEKVCSTAVVKNKRLLKSSQNLLKHKKLKRTTYGSPTFEIENSEHVPKSPTYDYNTDEHKQAKTSETIKNVKQKSVNKSINDVSSDRYNDNYNRQNFPYQQFHSGCYTIIANGREIKVVKFEGFLIKNDDAIALKKLRKKLRAQNIPNEKIKLIMKLERRKAEKALSREKNSVCFHCRKFGHNFSDCPDIKGSELCQSGICFKCGSMEHSHFQCKVLQSQDFRYAVCFVCKDQGHIARQCPLNPQGQYPKGGSCHLCGEVTHLRKDCPKADDENTTKSVTVETLKNDMLEDFSEMTPSKKDKNTNKKKIIKFK